MIVVVTRPAAQAAAWVDALRDQGVEARALPLIRIAPVADRVPVHEAWTALPCDALAVFVSPNAVEQFFALRPATALAWPAGTRAGATGPGTAAALRRAGVPDAAIVVPGEDAPSFDSEALWALLRTHDWAGRRVLVVRGTEGRDWLTDTLRGAGAEVHPVAAYGRMPPVLDTVGRALLADACAQPAAHVWHFSSSEAVRNLGHLQPGFDWSTSSALATHPRIVDSARAAGFGRVSAVGVRPHDVAAWLRASRQAPPIESSAP